MGLLTGIEGVIAAGFIGQKELEKRGEDFMVELLNEAAMQIYDQYRSVSSIKYNLLSPSSKVVEFESGIACDWIQELLDEMHMNTEIKTEVAALSTIMRGILVDMLKQTNEEAASLDTLVVISVSQFFSEIKDVNNIDKDVLSEFFYDKWSLEKAPKLLIVKLLNAIEKKAKELQK